VLPLGRSSVQYHTVPELLTAEFHFVPPTNHFCGIQADNFQMDVSLPSMFGHVMEVHTNIFPNYIGGSLLFFVTVRCDADCVWKVMAHAQKPYFVFRRNGRVHLNLPGASVQSTTSSRGVRISGSNAGYNMFRGSVKSTGYPLHSPVSPSLPLSCVTVCHHISTGLYVIRSNKMHTFYIDV